MKIRCKFRLFVVHFIEVKSEVSFTHPHVESCLHLMNLKKRAEKSNSAVIHTADQRKRDPGICQSEKAGPRLLSV